MKIKDDPTPVNHVLNALLDAKLSIYQLIQNVLTLDIWQSHPIVIGMVDNDLNLILECLRNSQSTSGHVLTWIYQRAEIEYQSQVLQLTHKTAGFRFLPASVTSAELIETEIEDIGRRMSHAVPPLWSLFSKLLEANPIHRKQRAQRAAVNQALQSLHGHRLGDTHIPRDGDGDITMSDPVPLPANFNVDEDLVTTLVDKQDDAPEDLEDQLDTLFDTLVTIKQVLCLSVITHSTNQQCNVLQTMVGLFLHSSNAPQTVMELLAHMGLSISSTAVQKSDSNLSDELEITVKDQGRKLLNILAYDNLDVDLKHLVPTVENPQNTLIHLTTGSLFPLMHGVTLEDLNCSSYLWDRFQHNFEAQQNAIPHLSYEELLAKIHPETPTLNPRTPGSSFKSSRRSRFNSWKYLQDLIEFGPEYFRTFRRQLGDPEWVDRIPIIKTTQTPLQALDLSPSSPGRNATAINMFFQQCGIGDPKKNPGAQDPANHVILLAGDLLTIQHLRSLRASRAEETTPFRRAQFMVFVMGLFHLKMAAADAIWKIFIAGADKEKHGPNNLLTLISQIRPKESRKMETKPGFRRMHECIQHVGIVMRLEAWRIAATKEFPGVETLLEFAAKQPSWDLLQKMAQKLATQNPTHTQMDKLQLESEAVRDQQRINIYLCEEYFLLYEELSWAMNHGDIGRVETCFGPWMLIFVGCGKHKYAAEMKRYLEEVHLLYPDGLRKAVRMNILCNPTGQKGHFRALDWVIEHNNLYIKRIYGGSYSNHTKERIIQQSGLIEVYKNIRRQFEQMFCLNHKTVRHSPAKMANTFEKLGEYMRKEKTMEYVKGRTAHVVGNAMNKGMLMAATRKALGGASGGMETDEEGEEGARMEIEDDGSLDT